MFDDPNTRDLLYEIFSGQVGMLLGKEMSYWKMSEEEKARFRKLTDNWKPLDECPECGRPFKEGK